MSFTIPSAEAFCAGSLTTFLSDRKSREMPDISWESGVLGRSSWARAHSGAATSVANSTVEAMLERRYSSWW